MISVKNWANSQLKYARVAEGSRDWSLLHPAVVVFVVVDVVLVVQAGLVQLGAERRQELAAGERGGGQTGSARGASRQTP